MTTNEGVAAALTTWFEAKLGYPVAIDDVHRHAEGWSWHTYTMTVSAADGTGKRHGYAVRREPEDGLLAPYDTRQQYRLHEAVLHGSDVPMADLHWLETDKSVLGMPFYVMDRVEGIVPAQWNARDPSIFPDDAARHAVGVEFVDILGRIHTIDPVSIGIDFLPTVGSSDEAAVRQIDWWEEQYERAKLFDVPLLGECIGWLRANVATSGQVRLVHGDYRIGNFMIDEHRHINAVFDWELAHVGDPAFDVAWAAMPLFRGRSPLVSQLIDREEYLARYTEATGIAIETEVMRFWTVFGHLRASAPHITAARAFEDGRAPDLRLAAMGHQNLFILRQLARELGYEAPPVGSSTEPTTHAGSPIQISLHNVLDKIADSLSTDVAPAVDDPFARSQASAAAELIRNLAARVEWRATDQVEALQRLRHVLRSAPEAAGIGEVVAHPLPDASEAAALNAALVAHYAALGELQTWLAVNNGDGDLSSAVEEFVLWDLAAQAKMLRTGMYRSRKPEDP